MNSIKAFNGASTILVILILSLFISISFVNAAPRSAPFAPGQTLDPGTDTEPCGPTDANCFPSLVRTSDEGTLLSSNVLNLNFVGAGVTAIHSGTTTTITIPGGTGLTSINGSGSTTQSFAVGTSGTDFSINTASGVHTFNIPSASATARGLVTTGAQTIAGLKTFTGGINTTAATIGTLNGLLSGTNGVVGAVATSSLNIALSDTTGILAVSRGGTGRNAFAIDSVLLGNGVSGFATTTRGTLSSGTGLSFTAGSGANALLGAGGTLALDINGLTSKTSVSNTNDFIAVYDSTLPGIRKITRGDFLQGLIGALTYQGSWNANTNSPTLSNGTGAAGQMYAVTSASTTVNLGSGPLTVGTGDFLIHNGTVWEVAPSAAAVTAVFGRTGAVTAQNGDYTASQITNVAAGTISGNTVQLALNELDTEKLSAALASGNLFVGNASNVAAGVALSGDATLANTGALTIGTGAVNSSKILDGTITNDDVSASAGIALSKLAGGSNVVTSLAAPSGSNANGGSVALNVLTLSLADATNPGLVSTSAQTFAGAKTFSSAPTFSTFTPGSVTFAGTGGLLSQSNSNFFWDNTNSRLGIGTSAPSGKVTIDTSAGGTALRLNIQDSTASQDIAQIRFGNSGIGLNNIELIARGDGAGGANYVGWGYGGPGAGNPGIILKADTGNVGLGTFSPTASLHVVKAVATSSAVAVDVNSLTTGSALALNTSSTGLTGNLANLSSTGNSAAVTGSVLNLNIAGALSGARGLSIANAGTGVSLDIAGAVAFKKGLDFSTVGTTNNAALGNASLIRLTGATAQTLTGIAGGVDGKLITIVNAGANAASLTNEDAASVAANRITTGTGATLAIPSKGSVQLVYDSSDLLWRVVGGSGGSTGSFSSFEIANDADGGAIGTAAATVDIHTNFNLDQTIASQTFTIPSPTVDLAARGKIITINNIGTANFAIGGITVPAGSYGSAFVWNGTVWNPLNAASNVASESLVARAAADQTVSGIAATTNLIIGTTISSNGSSITNSGGGTYTLKAGKTYQLNASLSFTGDGDTYDEDFQWYNVTGSAYIGSAGNFQDFTGDSSTHASQPVAVFTPGVDSVVVIRPVSVVSSNVTDLKADSNVTISVVSGNAPVTGQTVDYIHVGSATVNVPIVGASTLAFPTVLNGNDTIPYNTANGQFTLTAGKTYKLEATPAAGTGYWWNVTASVALSEDSSGNSSATSAGIDAVAYFTPTVTTIVEVRGTGTNSANGISSGSANARITQIGSSALTGGLAFNSLTNAIAIGALDNTNFAQTWNWSTATTETGLTMNANALTTGEVLAITSNSAALNSTNGLLYVANTGAVTNGTIFRAQSSSITGSGLTVLANGRVGIGTSTPSSIFTIAGDGFTSPNNAGLRLVNTGTSPRQFMISSRSDGANGSRFSISDETAGAARLTVGANGFVGVGEEGPGARLHLKGDGNTDGNQVAIRFQSDGGSGRTWNVGTRGDGGTQRFFISDETGAAERFGIDSTGRTWVGQGAAPQIIPGVGNAGLNVISIGGSDGLSIRGPGANNALNIYNPTGGDTTLISFITDDGGTAQQKGRVWYDSIINTTNYLTTSDERLKTDTGREAKGLEDILKLKVRNYDWNQGGGNLDGFFAQELAGIVPSAVYKGTDELDENGNLKNPWSVDYGKLTPILAKSIQDLNFKLENGTQSVSLEDLEAWTQSAAIANYLEDIEDEDSRDVTEYFTAKMTGGYKFVTDFASERVTALRGYFDQLFARKATVETFCVGTEDDRTCITKDQLDSLLENANVSESTPYTSDDNVTEEAITEDEDDSTEESSEATEEEVLEETPIEEVIEPEPEIIEETPTEEIVVTG